MGERCTSVGVRSTSVGVRSGSVGLRSGNIGVRSRSVGVQSGSVGVRSTSIGVRSTSVGVRLWACARNLRDEGSRYLRDAVRSTSVAVRSSSAAVLRSRPRGAGADTRLHCCPRHGWIFISAHPEGRPTALCRPDSKDTRKWPPACARPSSPLAKNARFPQDERIVDRILKMSWTGVRGYRLSFSVRLMPIFLWHGRPRPWKPSRTAGMADLPWHGRGRPCHGRRARAEPERRRYPFRSDPSPIVSYRPRDPVP